MVGGSGLFIQALLEDMQFPPGDAAVRARLEQECEELGLATLYKRLMDFDPEAGAKVNPANARRVIRALEVICRTEFQRPSFGSSQGSLIQSSPYRPSGPSMQLLYPSHGSFEGSGI